MKLKAISAFFLFLLMSTVIAVAQAIDVKGTVIDESTGEPIIGASVTVAGTKMAVVTDAEGRFSFPKLSTSHKIIRVTYVGMEPIEAKIQPQMTIAMKPHSEMMDEVVVVAFGKQKREAFTGSAAVIKGDDIVKRQSNNPISALEGKVPGLTMLSSNNPTGENTINIRGLGSINASTSPLIILDGQPYSGSWRDINPADVDNISVLKDAASTALYGARAANGVIMITTKNAQKGKTRVTFDMKWGANTDALVDYDVIDNAPEYYEAHYLALRNYNMRTLGMSASDAHLSANATMITGDTDNGGLGYIVYSVPNGQTLIGSNGRLNPNATLGNRVYNNGNIFTLIPDNWRDHGLRTGFRQEYSMSLTGGNENTSTYFSLGYLSDEGISYGSDLQRITARLKTDYQAFSWVKIGANASYTHAEYNNENNSFSTVHDLAPIYPLFLRDAYGNVMTDARGPMYDYGDGTVGFVRVIEKNANAIQADRLDKSKYNSNSFIINGYANFDFLKDFRLSINASARIHESRSSSATNPYYGYYATTGGNVTTSTSRGSQTNFNQLLTWNHTFGKNSIELLIGHEYSRSTSGSLSASKSEIAIFEDNIELSGAIINGTASGSTGFTNHEGYLSRAQWDYDSRYFANASYRRDASNRFHPDHRWGDFWSLGAAWMISKEAWFPKSPFINSLKIKASYGEQGNDNIGGNYYWIDCYTIKNSNNEIGYTFNWKGNPNISWETTGNLNTGLEFDFFNSRLSGTVEYYWRKTSDMLYFKTVPSTLGYSGYYDNVGDMVNKGIEVTLNGTVIRTKDIAWNINLNFAFEHNEVTYLPDTSKGLIVDGHNGYQGSYYFTAEGLPRYTWYIPVYTGPNDKGQPTWKVTNDDGSFTTTTQYDEATYYTCGSALPKGYGGFGTTLQVYGFDFTAAFTFTIGGKKLDNGYLSLMGSPWGSSIGQNIHRDALTGWSEDNLDAWIPRWQYNDTQNNMVSDFYLIDASQLTFKSCQLGYTIPKKLSRVLKMSRLRVYFSVDNVWYWTKRKGFDPRGGRTTFNGTGYSPMRTFVGGLNVVF